ncbi:oxygen-dependent tRNA uridine(34) hydroxylase TrhO [Pseudoblastomonas halimionae]|uniref:tRNA uridine(34) hydroxylase n=1 Tax=Alteriqipengyuania halimionae TaxID=1926630 RepID=A0A6I4U315_9SPHN|nr:rhodanese-related sulfurtransferase [Alteriqipengyuania halimionae]MXP08882.1 rhodanese-related sulfurtransferase [Alteriqipengyuania halimionae]
MTMPIEENAQPICVAALYRFASLDGIAQLREPLKRLCDDEGIKGTLLLASEGINGTIAGFRGGIDRVLDHIRSWLDCADLDVKFSGAATMPFHRMKVRLKQEIVTMGQPGIDPAVDAGTYVDPHDWNALVDDPDTIVIDTRNDYEVSIGSFAGSINPMTGSFRDFPEWFARERERLLGSENPPRVAMFCTGGIRCEKASAFLKKEGLEDVFHLKGGILAYLEAMPEEESRWEGECFVFDQRVAVGHALSQGTHELCFACRRPVSEADKQSPLYEPGVSCPACHGERDDEQRASYRERHRQEMRAASEGRAHVGAVLAETGANDGD